MKAKPRKKTSKADIIRTMCNIQKEIDDTVIFTVGIRENGKVIDILSVENLLHKRRNEKAQENSEHQLEVQLPEVPDYIG